MEFLLPEDKEKYTKLYHEVDKEHGKGNGALTVDVYEKLLEKCDLPLPKFLVGSTFVEADENQDWRISLDEFLKEIAQIVEPEPFEKAKRKFKELDIDEDGLLSFEDTKEFLTKILPGLDEDLMRTFFNTRDKDDDGKITSQQFSIIYLEHADPDKYKTSHAEVAEASPVPIGAKIRKIFEESDKDKDGLISLKDLRTFRDATFPEYTKWDFKQLFDLYDDDGDGRMTLGDFVSLYMQDVAPFDNGTDIGQRREAGILVEDKIRRKFTESDLDGDGFLSREDVSRLILTTFPSLSENDLNKDFYSNFDDNEDGKISFEEFIPMFLFHLRPDCYYDSDSESDDEVEIDQALHGKRLERENKLRKQFEESDLNKDGLLTFEELRSFLSKHLPEAKESELRNYFDSWDDDKDGKINFIEFMPIFIDLIWIDSDDED